MRVVLLCSMLFAMCCRPPIQDPPGDTEDPITACPMISGDFDVTSTIIAKDETAPACDGVQVGTTSTRRISVSPDAGTPGCVARQNGCEFRLSCVTYGVTAKFFNEYELDVLDGGHLSGSLTTTGEWNACTRVDSTVEAVSTVP